MPNFEACECGTCEHVAGRVAYGEYVVACETKGCPERTFGFVARRLDAPCRKCGQPCAAKHSVVVEGVR